MHVHVICSRNQVPRLGSKIHSQFQIWVIGTRFFGFITDGKCNLGLSSYLIVMTFDFPLFIPSTTIVTVCVDVDIHI